MIEKLKGLRNTVEKQMDSISVNTQSLNLNNFMTLSFPLLLEKNFYNEVEHIQTSF